MSEPTPGDIYPSLTYDNASAAVEWLCSAFGFKARLVIPGPDDSIMHSELTLGTAVIMVSSPKPDSGRIGAASLKNHSLSLCVRIDDPDSHFQQAKSQGAEIIQEPKDEEYGSRGYMVKDLEGQEWYFGTYQPGAYWDGAGQDF